MILGGCGGGDGAAPTTLPQSAASYMGSNMPAKIDSTSGSNYFDLYSQLFSARGVARAVDSGGQDLSGHSIIDGDIRGTITYRWHVDLIYGPTGTSTVTSNVFEYDDFMDSGDGDPSYVMRGSGSRYNEFNLSERYDGLVPGATSRSANGSGVGTYLGAERMEYVNYSDFAESTSDLDPNNSPYDELTAGWALQKYSHTGSPGVWSLNQDVNMAYNNFTDDVYRGLLDATATAGYDGSFTTLEASGKFCYEGTSYDGCLTYEMDLQWDGDEDLKSTTALPDDGTINISTIIASAMFDFGYTSDPLCYLFSLDADNDSAYEFTSVGCR